MKAASQATNENTHGEMDVTPSTPSSDSSTDQSTLLSPFQQLNKQMVIDAAHTQIDGHLNLLYHNDCEKCAGFRQHWQDYLSFCPQPVALTEQLALLKQHFINGHATDAYKKGFADADASNKEYTSGLEEKIKTYDEVMDLLKEAEDEIKELKHSLEESDRKVELLKDEARIMVDNTTLLKNRILALERAAAISPNSSPGLNDRVAVATNPPSSPTRTAGPSLAERLKKSQIASSTVVNDKPLPLANRIRSPSPPSLFDTPSVTVRRKTRKENKREKQVDRLDPTNIPIYDKPVLVLDEEVFYNNQHCDNPNPALVADPTDPNSSVRRDSWGNAIVSTTNVWRDHGPRRIVQFADIEWGSKFWIQLSQALDKVEWEGLSTIQRAWREFTNCNLRGKAGTEIVRRSKWIHWQRLGHLDIPAFKTESWASSEEIRDKYGYTHLNLPSAVHLMDGKIATTDVKFWDFITRILPEAEVGHISNFKFVRNLARRYKEAPRWMANILEEFKFDVNELPLEAAGTKRYNPDDPLIPLRSPNGLELNVAARLAWWLLSIGYSREIDHIARRFFYAWAQEPLVWGSADFGPVTVTTPAPKVPGPAQSNGWVYDVIKNTHGGTLKYHDDIVTLPPPADATSNTTQAPGSGISIDNDTVMADTPTGPSNKSVIDNDPGPTPIISPNGSIICAQPSPDWTTIDGPSASSQSTSSSHHASSIDESDYLDGDKPSQKPNNGWPEDKMMW